MANLGSRLRRCLLLLLLPTRVQTRGRTTIPRDGLEKKPAPRASTLISPKYQTKPYPRSPPPPLCAACCGEACAYLIPVAPVLLSSLPSFLFGSSLSSRRLKNKLGILTHCSHTSIAETCLRRRKLRECVQIHARRCHESLRTNGRGERGDPTSCDNPREGAAAKSLKQRLGEKAKIE